MVSYPHKNLLILTEKIFQPTGLLIRAGKPMLIKVK